MLPRRIHCWDPCHWERWCRYLQIPLVAPLAGAGAGGVAAESIHTAAATPAIRVERTRSQPAGVRGFRACLGRAWCAGVQEGAGSVAEQSVIAIGGVVIQGARAVVVARAGGSTGCRRLGGAVIIGIGPVGHRTARTLQAEQVARCTGPVACGITAEPIHAGPIATKAHAIRGIRTRPTTRPHTSTAVTSCMGCVWENRVITHLPRYGCQHQAGNISPQQRPWSHGARVTLRRRARPRWCVDGWGGVMGVPLPTQQDRFPHPRSSPNGP